MSTPTLAFKSAVLAPDEAADLVIAEAENIVAGAAAFEGDGIVTAIVSVTGVVDEVDDIIEPGAYAETLRKRLPKVCWHHSWEHPIGKVLWIEELMPGDPRLPSKTRDGQPWPAEAGALVAKMQMNMKSERGREAYSAIKFYSESGECEYSIGYKVPQGKSTRDGKGIRHIKVMDLFELSFVLFGAHTMTGTLALKAAVRLMGKAEQGLVTLSRAAIDAEFKRLMEGVEFKDLAEDDDVVDLTGDEDDVENDEDDLEPNPDEPTDVGPDDQEVLDIGDDEDDLEHDLDTDEGVAALHQAAMADPEFAMHHNPEGKAAGGADKNRGNAEKLRHWYVAGAGGQIAWGTPGDFEQCVAVAGKHMDPERAKGYCNLRHQDAVGAPPGQGHPESKAQVYDQPDTTAPDDDSDVLDDPKLTGVMVALFPDPEAAKKIAVRGGDDPEDLHVTLAYLGKTSDQAGEGLTLEAATSKIVAAAQTAAATFQPLSGTVGGVGKFPDHGDGVPVFAPVDVVGLGAVREAVVDALEAGGLPVKMDHGFTPHMTLGFNLDMDLIPDSEPVPVEFTHLVVAVGGTHTRIPLGSDAGADASDGMVPGEPSQGPAVAGEPLEKGYDPMLETGPYAGHKDALSSPEPVSSKGFPRLAGSLEERMSAISRALEEALLGDLDDEERKNRYVGVDGTWMDRVICTVNHWAGPNDGECESFEYPYTMNDDGTVSLGEPVPVKLKLTAELDGDEVSGVPVGDLMPISELVGQAIAGIKFLGPTEIKAGRVLSANNASQIKGVVETLLTVLKAAGIDITPPEAQDSVAPTPDMETTAPAARGKSAVMPTPAEVAALLADIEQSTAE
jgi:2'-5' RNA ligase